MSSPKRVLVVGNSDGIGLALTRRLVGEGSAVAGISRRASPLGDVAGYHHTIVDVATHEYPAVLRALVDSEGPFDVCVYCAGIGQPLDTADLSGEARVFRVNLLGAVETAAIILPAMRAAGGGHFVALSSIGDGHISAGAPSYFASKAGLSSYLAGLTRAFRPHGVRVTNLRFGFVDTKLAKGKLRPFMITPERAADVIARCLRRRPARFTYPKRMAALVWFMNRISAVRAWFA